MYDEKLYLIPSTNLIYIQYNFDEHADFIMFIDCLLLQLILQAKCKLLLILTISPIHTAPSMSVYHVHTMWITSFAFKLSGLFWFT